MFIKGSNSNGKTGKWLNYDVYFAQSAWPIRTGGAA
jgi:hypothetical protein